MDIRREIIGIFKKWKESSDRKPLLLKGARQIGKTWAMEKFGHECFEYVVKFDFDRQPELKSIFKITKEPIRIIRELALYCDSPIIAGKTLIIFDEIQECEEALNSLKYFCEDAPQFHVMAAGSLLGVAVKKKRMTLPVGKVQVVRMFPITFKEFLYAADFSTYSYIESLNEISRLPEIILNKINSEYRRYQICGGMPESTVALLENKGMAEVERKLQDILDLYELDFAKYADPKEIPRISAIWHSLPAQLAKEHRKFVYKIVKSGARSKDYEDALMWLEDAGMIYRIYDISKPGMPLSAYQEYDAFKIYACDCGLLRRLASLPPEVILNPVSNYTEFKGSLAENTVLQNIKPLMDSDNIYYWTSDGRAEIEFVLQWKINIIPVEVKAENNIGGNSLSVYNHKYEPKYRVRFSLRNLQYNGGLLSAPSPMSAWFDMLYDLLTATSTTGNQLVPR
ncbi:MAG: ATP-binding protein [Muribaculaceae bacterium]|nr:ATP-binding protein [Muribaculaceae bacterium]